MAGFVFLLGIVFFVLPVTERDKELALAAGTITCVAGLIVGASEIIINVF